MDMVRYHLACANAKQWGSEYGISEEREVDLKNLLSYSPYHNVRSGVVYPAILATTADHDDRVVPWHSYKWIARLQAAAQEQPDTLRPPLLLRVDLRAGHGAGKSVSQSIEETADILLFLKEIIPGLSLPQSIT
jgi:prolyl oligopeptidase